MSHAQFKQRKPLTRRLFQLSVKANGAIAMSSDIENDVPQYTVGLKKYERAGVQVSVYGLSVPA